MNNTCGIIFIGDSLTHDNNGCLRQKNNHKVHIFKDKRNGKLIAWEEDFECKCGCWDKYDKGDPDVCCLYWDIDNVNESQP
jgi:hypothetical protein